MKEKFEQLLHMVERKRATDVHFTLMQHRLHVQVRGWNGLETVQNAAFDEGLFCYLKYISNLDLGNTLQPQSGNFQYEFRQELLYFRFSLLPTLEKQTAVLRVLNNHKEISLEDLSLDSKQTASFLNWTKTRSGLIVLSGPTGSGKTTTLHAILKRIARRTDCMSYRWRTLLKSLMTAICSCRSMRQAVLPMRKESRSFCVMIRMSS